MLRIILKITLILLHKIHNFTLILLQICVSGVSKGHIRTLTKLEK